MRKDYFYTSHFKFLMSILRFFVFVGLFISSTSLTANTGEQAFSNKNTSFGNVSSINNDEVKEDYVVASVGHHHSIPLSPTDSDIPRETDDVEEDVEEIDQDLEHSFAQLIHHFFYSRAYYQLNAVNSVPQFVQTSTSYYILFHSWKLHCI